MIIQGDNHPSVIFLDTNVRDWPGVTVGLYPVSGSVPLKKWEKDDLILDKIGEEFSIACPWTEEETAALPTGRCRWLMKAKDPESRMIFWQELPEFVAERSDRGVRL